MPTIASVQRASDLIERTSGGRNDSSAGGRWSRAGLSRSLVELVSGPDSASLSAVSSLIVQGQAAGELVGWVSTRTDCFFPPDFAARGIDLAALPVVSTAQVGDEKSVANRAVRAAEQLLRSGAFGLIVIDLADGLELPQAGQGRLLHLAEHHDAIALILRRRRRDRQYSGSLVTVRAETRREQIASSSDTPADPALANRFRITITCTKDKREGPGWSVIEYCHGPPGMH